MKGNSNWQESGNYTGSNAGLTLGALFIGLAAGTVVGILLAPNKGTETRSNILSNMTELGNTVTQRARQGVEKLTEIKDQAIDSVRSKVEAIIGQRNIEDPSYAYESTASSSSTIPATSQQRKDWLSN